tara:strand:+ start:322 stop:768 length:447 start_codon:yes stop_codon:yes gene_type:complete
MFRMLLSLTVCLALYFLYAKEALYGNHYNPLGGISSLFAHANNAISDLVKEASLVPDEQRRYVNVTLSERNDRILKLNISDGTSTLFATVKNGSPLMLLTGHQKAYIIHPLSIPERDNQSENYIVSAVAILCIVRHPEPVCDRVAIYE